MTPTPAWHETRVDVKRKDRPCPVCGVVESMLASQKYCKSCMMAKREEWKKTAWTRGNLKKRIPPTTRKCVTCGKEFSGLRNVKTCSKECRDEKDKKYYLEIQMGAEGKTKTRIRSLERYYGITIKDKERMVSDQDGRCAICGIVMGGFSNACVDHDHKTGKIRSILCRLCNMGLGGFKDNQTSLESAIAYLKKHENV